MKQTIDCSWHLLARPQCRGQPKIFLGGGQNVAFRRATPFLFGTPLHKHNVTRYAKHFLGGMAPPGYAFACPQCRRAFARDPALVTSVLI